MVALVLQRSCRCCQTVSAWREWRYLRSSTRSVGDLEDSDTRRLTDRRKGSCLILLLSLSLSLDKRQYLKMGRSNYFCTRSLSLPPFKRPRVLALSALASPDSCNNVAARSQTNQTLTDVWGFVNEFCISATTMHAESNKVQCAPTLQAKLNGLCCMNGSLEPAAKHFSLETCSTSQTCSIKQSCKERHSHTRVVCCLLYSPHLIFSFSFSSVHHPRCWHLSFSTLSQLLLSL